MSYRYNNFQVLDVCQLASTLNLTQQKMRQIFFRAVRTLGRFDIKGKRILEIGAGDGTLSCLMSLAGAEHVVALEPEIAGSTKGVYEKFKENINKLGINNLTLVDKTLQDYDMQPNSFDLMVSVGSVNHWDEEACINLYREPDAKQIYRDIFKNILYGLKTRGQLSVFEMGKWNLFSWTSNRWGIPNPLLPSVEWYKHQQPRLWAKLLHKAGFSEVTWKWFFPVPPFKGAKLVLDNPIFNNPLFTYFTTSKFVIWAIK